MGTLSKHGQGAVRHTYAVQIPKRKPAANAPGQDFPTASSNSTGNKEVAMSTRPRAALVLTALIACIAPAVAQPPPLPPLYEEDVKATNGLRTEQARELDLYIKSLRDSSAPLASVFKPDYTSAKAYVKSTEPYRRRFAQSIGYPPPGLPPGLPPKDAATFDKIGEDQIGTYFRARIPVLPGVSAEGIYIVPRGVKGRAPLVIAMHGGGGSPEVALFHGGANYHDMVRGGARRGYVVFAPQHLFNADDYPPNVRTHTDDRLRLIGTSLTAVEIAKITRSLDVLCKRPEVDPSRIGMVGLSYGGYYTLVTMAVEPRIKAGVSSCYFGVQEMRYGKSEDGIPSDFRFPARQTLFRDPDLVALICPRALQIQAGKNDDAEHRDGGIALSPRAAAYYQNVKRPGDFEFVLFNGGHEFHDESAWSFLEKHL